MLPKRTDKGAYTEDAHNCSGVGAGLWCFRLGGHWAFGSWRAGDPDICDFLRRAFCHRLAIRDDTARGW